MLGFCPACDCLKTIRPGPFKWGSRERVYYTIPHDVYTHDGCGEVVDFSDDFEEGIVCRKCGKIGAEVLVGPCPGDKRAIK